MNTAQSAPSEQPSQTVKSGGSLTQKFKLTKAQIILIILIVGLVGVFFLYRSFAATIQQVPMYQLYNAKTKDYLYTINSKEKDSSVKNGYKYEKVAGYVYDTQVKDTKPFYRLYKSSARIHFYTANENERRSFKRQGFRDEGRVFIYTTNTKDTARLYRLYHKQSKSYFYTTNTAERDQAVKLGGYVLQSSSVYLLKNPPAATPPKEEPPKPTTPTTPSPTTPTPIPPTQTTAPTWYADYSTGDFRQWSWWGQTQEYMWGHISVVNPAQYGIPAPTVGSPKHVARMEVTADDAANDRPHAKLYKSWQENGKSPADVSGTYTSWYYIPSGYAIPKDGSAVNIFQWKELDKSTGQSDPLWWINLGGGSWARSFGGSRKWINEPPATGDAPVAFLNYWYSPWKRQVAFYTVPLDRWFEIRADLYQNDRIDFYIDGKLFDTARASEYPVSPFKGANSKEWIFGVGNYTSTPNTLLYLGGASYTKRQ